MNMFVLCAYLSAMAGITALCYVFRKRPEDVVDPGPDVSGVADADLEKKADSVPSIAITPPPPTEKTKSRGRKSLTPETQAKIQKVLDFVNTPSDELVQETEGKGSEKGGKLELPAYSKVNVKKPKEVIDDLKQSKAKVEAWISKLDKVIHTDEVDPVVDKQGRRGRPVRPNMLSSSTEARRQAHQERQAKVKEEVAKRRTALGNKAEGSRRREEEEKQSASKKRSPSPERSSGGPSHRREVTDVPKRDSSVKTRTSESSRQSSPSSAHTGDDKKLTTTTTRKLSTTKEEVSAKSGASRGTRRAAPTSHKQDAAPTSHKQDAAATQEDKEATPAKTGARPEAKVETAQKAKTQPKPASSFEVRMKYGRQSRTPAATSKIPLMVNSRARPPVARPARVPHEEKTPAPVVVQKPKKSIRITNDPLLIPRRADDTPATPTVEATLSGRRSISQVTPERSRSAVFQRASLTRGEVPDEAAVAQTAELLPELNILDVRGSKSSNHQAKDIQAEVHVAQEGAARVAKSGPIRLSRNGSLSRSRSVSIANLRGVGSTSGQPGGLPMSQPVAVTKTVQLPEGTEDNVTVYFSVTMPRRVNSDINWTDHEEGDVAVTKEEVEKEEVAKAPTVVEREEEDEEDEEDSKNEWTDDHSDDGVFRDDEIIGANIAYESDDYPSSTGGFDEREFDSSDEQF